MTQSNTSASTSGGVGFTSLLTLLFIGLKLTGHIDWTWVWVLSPIWISLALVAAILSIVAVVFLGNYFLQQRKRRRRV